MLSILIPVYNFDVRGLVGDLSAQAKAISVPVEILCLDDGSDPGIRNINRAIAGLAKVRYEELAQNVGRSAIRNELAQRATHPFLLFMDCDSEVVNDDFLEQYLAAIQPGWVVVGKRVYAPDPPEVPGQYLRWYYGLHREQQPAAKRNQQPYHAFCTAHFLCPREIFLEIGLDKRLTGYGHEDTQFGMDLRDRGVPVLHIDAALRHIDLEGCAEFLQKSKNAVENLAFLWQQDGKIETRLLRAYHKCRAWRSAGLLRFIWRKGAGIMERRLCRTHPNLRLFDLYKLSYLANCLAQKKETTP